MSKLNKRETISFYTNQEEHFVLFVEMETIDTS